MTAALSGHPGPGMRAAARTWRSPYRVNVLAGPGAG
jgi:hypothetical protein